MCEACTGLYIYRSHSHEAGPSGCWVHQDHFHFSFSSLSFPLSLPRLPSSSSSRHYAKISHLLPVLIFPFALILVAPQAPLSTGILQARILEWVARLSSRGPSQPPGMEPDHQHFRQILYQLSNQGSPDTEWNLLYKRSPHFSFLPQSSLLIDLKGLSQVFGFSLKRPNLIALPLEVAVWLQ